MVPGLFLYPLIFYLFLCCMEMFEKQIEWQQYPRIDLMKKINT